MVCGGIGVLRCMVVSFPVDWGVMYNGLGYSVSRHLSLSL